MGPGQLSPQAETRPSREGAAAFLWGRRWRFRGLPGRRPLRGRGGRALRWRDPWSPLGLAPGEGVGSRPRRGGAEGLRLSGELGPGAGGAAARERLPFPPPSLLLSGGGGGPRRGPQTRQGRQRWDSAPAFVSLRFNTESSRAGLRLVQAPHSGFCGGRAPSPPLGATPPCAHAPVASTGQADSPCAHPSTVSRTAQRERPTLSGGGSLQPRDATRHHAGCKASARPRAQPGPSASPPGCRASDCPRARCRRGPRARPRTVAKRCNVLAGLRGQSQSISPGASCKQAGESPRLVIFFFLIP